MRNVRVEVWCDVCGNADVPATVPADTYTVALGPRLTAVEVDLCPECHALVLEPLAAVLEAYGSKPVAAGKAVAAPYAHRRGRATVSAGEDANSLEVLVRRQGEGTRRGMPATKPRNYVCLWCPLDYASSGGLLNHLGKVHGVADPATPRLYGTACPMCGATMHQMANHVAGHGGRTVPLLFVMAAHAGDPHGVVARIHGKVKRNVLTDATDLAGRPLEGAA